MTTATVVAKYGSVLDTVNAMLRVARRRVEADRWDEAAEILDAAAYLMETVVKAAESEERDG